MHESPRKAIEQISPTEIRENRSIKNKTKSRRLHIHTLKYTLFVIAAGPALPSEINCGIASSRELASESYPIKGVKASPQPTNVDTDLAGIHMFPGLG